MDFRILFLKVVSINPSKLLLRLGIPSFFLFPELFLLLLLEQRLHFLVRHFSDYLVNQLLLVRFWYLSKDYFCLPLWDLVVWLFFIPLKVIYPTFGSFTFLTFFCPLVICFDRPVTIFSLECF